MQNFFLALLRTAMNGEPFDGKLENQDWKNVFLIAQQQSLTGVIWPVVKNIPLPLDVAMQWIGITENIRGLNELLNAESARLTQVFQKARRKTAILKGQANARLYPDKLLRQPGDIDIWVDRNKGSVTKLLLDLGLLDDQPTIADAGKQ